MATQHETTTERHLDLDNPRRYMVILHNDDYTTMDFVVEILQDIFHKNEQEAVNIMIQVHKDGRGVCGVYVYEIAETKAKEVKEKARANSFPLKCTIESE